MNCALLMSCSLLSLLCLAKSLLIPEVPPASIVHRNRHSPEVPDLFPRELLILHYLAGID